MNRRQALSGVAETLREKLRDLRELDAKYGDGFGVETGTRDQERVLRAWDELDYRLARIVDPSTRREPKPTRQDPNQIELFG